MGTLGREVAEALKPSMECCAAAHLCCSTLTGCARTGRKKSKHDQKQDVRRRQEEDLEVKRLWLTASAFAVFTRMSFSVASTGRQLCGRERTQTQDCVWSGQSPGIIPWYTP